MCIIVDANVAHKLAANPCDADAIPLRDRVENRRLEVASGGRNAEELLATKLRRWLVEQTRSGTVRIYPPALLKAEESRCQQRQKCVSNDHHIIALARVSGARVLYTVDAALRRDFKNKDLVDNPRGRIYSSRRNASLLDQAGLCRRIG